VTRSSSSAPGSPVRRSAGRTLAAIPKSVIQISPGLTAGIVVLHAVEHHCPFQSGLIAERHVRAFVGDGEQDLPDGPPVGLGELGKFPDDFGGAHAGNLAVVTGIVSLQFLCATAHFERHPFGAGDGKMGLRSNAALPGKTGENLEKLGKPSKMKVRMPRF